MVRKSKYNFSLYKTTTSQKSLFQSYVFNKLQAFNFRGSKNVRKTAYRILYSLCVIRYFRFSVVHAQCLSIKSVTKTTNL